jgi:hypothetical protein
MFLYNPYYIQNKSDVEFPLEIQVFLLVKRFRSICIVSLSTKTEPKSCNSSVKYVSFRSSWRPSPGSVINVYRIKEKTVPSYGGKSLHLVWRKRHYSHPSTSYSKDLCPRIPAKSENLRKEKTKTLHILWRKGHYSHPFFFEGLVPRLPAKSENPRKEKSHQLLKASLHSQPPQNVFNTL